MTFSRAFDAQMLCVLSVDDLVELYLKQDGRCAFTGLQMTLKVPSHAGRGRRANAQGSIDRINSSGNYTLDNVQLVLQIVNLMKNDLPQQAFLDLCELITARRMGGAIAA